MTLKKPLIAMFMVATLPACSMMQASAAGPAKCTDGILTVVHGTTLYTFDRNPHGRR